MQTIATTNKSKRKLPAWAGWLIGYAAVLCAAAALVYYWRVVFLLPAELPAAGMTLGVMGIFTLVYAAVFALSRLKGDNLCLKAALLIFVVGLLFCFATAPFQVPDEVSHYLRAVSLSHGRFTSDYSFAYGNDVNLLVQNFAEHMNHSITYQAGQLAPVRLAAYQQALAGGQAAAMVAKAPILYLVLPFLPQALFMAIARAFGAGALGLLYAGRIANLLVYTLLCYVAFRNLKAYRGVFFAAALLPLSLSMAASCSYDSLMLALCFLLLSYLFKEKFTRPDLIVFLLALMLAASIKPNNILFAAVLLLIPIENYSFLKSKKWVWLAFGIAFAAALVYWYAAGEIDNLLKVNWDSVNLESHRGSGDNANPAGQLAFVLKNPLRFVMVSVQTLLEQELFLFKLGVLGNMDLALPLVSGLSVLVLGLSSVFSVRQEEKTKRSVFFGTLALALGYALIILPGLYVTDTDLESIRITGLQPRYFLPAFLLLFVLAAMLLGRFVAPRRRPLKGPAAAVTAEKVVLWAAVGLALLAAVLLFQSYFIGQWVPKTEGGFRLVNLYGWVQT